MDSVLAVESPGDSWDHPDLLASIDNICSSHFRINKRDDEPPLSNSYPFLPHHSANLTQQPSAPQTDLSSLPITKEKPAFHPSPPKLRSEGFSQFGSRLRGSSSQPGSKDLADLPTYKKPGSHKRTQKIWNQRKDIPNSYWEWI